MLFAFYYFHMKLFQNVEKTTAIHLVYFKDYTVQRSIYLSYLYYAHHSSVHEIRFNLALFKRKIPFYA